MIAHDLRAPLRQVMDLSALAAETTDEVERIALLEDIRAVAARMALLLDHLMTMDQHQGAEDQRPPVSLRGVVSSALTHFADAIADMGGSVAITGDVRARGDGVLLEQLFRNVIGNAIKYRGDRAPVIAITLGRVDEEAVVVVADKGLGIPPQDRVRVFEPSVRLHADSAPGHGVGLALCREIAAAHDGTIDTEEPRGDEATRIVVRMPLAT